MAVFIALLKGINVGGKNRIKMDNLKKMFENLGFWQVSTYIQTGNVLFESDKDEDELKVLIEGGMEKEFGFKATVVLRTAQQLVDIIINCPFSQDEIYKAQYLNKEGESLYVCLAVKEPESQRLELL